ncbi:hypothetical protein V1264_018636 [Littorina saxatilis]|uniref:Mammalian ependymin-related protein 1 n=2 Tax=Littorina saxatilis TaxID=31220 RepID=A0AAN9BD05_9CAEN
MLAAILLFGLAFVAAQQPRPCESPAQWQAKLYRSDYSKNFTEFAKVTYDETNKRVREIEELDFNSDREFYDVLYLHNQGVEYRLGLKSRQCNKTALTRPFRPFGIPPESRYEGEFNLGPVNIPNEHVTVISFFGKFEDGSEYVGTVSSPDCIPVSSGFYANTTGFVHTSFYDVVPGIPDPTVFDIPSECGGPGR